MAFLVNSLVESAGELLHRMDQNLLALAIHFEALGEGLALPLDHSLAREDHVRLDLVLEHFHLTCCLVVLVHDCLMGFVSLLAYALGHNVLQSFDLVAPEHL